MTIKNPKHSKEISSDQLCRLSPIAVFEGGSPQGNIASLSFESFESGDACLLLNGEIFHNVNVTFLRREGKLIELWCSRRAKFMLTLENLLEEWVTALEDSVVYMVK
jgi:hypothetical protein